MKKISTKPYKGTRDFYPEDMRVRDEVFSVLRRTVELYGYEPYDGPMLEPVELYAAKTGDEIVREQLYAFQDRGERWLALRPEMTPTLARMIAKRQRELPRPVRWYSIPNLWRYENPQRGRLREHWQLNVDIFGAGDIYPDAELVQLSIDILKGLGADSSMFRVRINSREVTDCFLLRILGLEPDLARSVIRIIDRKNKIPVHEFDGQLSQVLGDSDTVKKIREYIDIGITDLVRRYPAVSESMGDLERIYETLRDVGLGEYVVYDPTIVRGFEYYTGFVFEVFDQHPDNRRSLYGGGRYDRLLEIFGAQAMPAVGFGLGDVTLFDFLSTHGLLPTCGREGIVALVHTEAGDARHLMALAERMRRCGIRVDIGWGLKRVARQIQHAERKGIPFVVFYGEKEREEQVFLVKDIRTGRQRAFLDSDKGLGQLSDILRQRNSL